MPDGLAARTLATLGIDPAALRRALEEARRQPPYPGLVRIAELGAEIEKVREQKEANIEAHEFEAAAQLRDRERQLVNQLPNLEDDWPDYALAEMRGWLGLSDK